MFNLSRFKTLQQQWNLLKATTGSRTTDGLGLLDRNMKTFSQGIKIIDNNWKCH